MYSFSGRGSVPHLRSYSICTLLAAILTILPTIVQAQGGGATDSTGTGGRHTIQGRIYFPSGRQSDLRTKVKLENTNSGGLSVLADMDGAFKFTNLGSGSYTIVIEAGQDYETARESVYIEGNSSLGRGMRMSTVPRTIIVPIYLQLKPSAKAATRAGVVNAALAGVPKRAADLYTEGLAAAQAGDVKKAIEQLREAILVHPEFPLALNELGVQYLKRGQADRAVEVLQRAVKLSPDAISPRLNYGFALLEQKNFAAAEAELRQVLKLNDGVATAHLYLGISLIYLRNYSEAEKELQRAVSFGSAELSIAHYYLGGIYWRNKEYKRAADELETYLKLSPNAHDADRTRATIKELRAKQTTD